MALYRQSIRTVVAGAITAAILTSGIIYGLNHWAGQSAGIELRLVELKGELHRLSALEWEVIASRQVDARAGVELLAIEARIDRIGAEIGRSGADGASGEVQRLYRAYSGALDREFTLVKENRIDEAVEYDEATVDPLFDKLVTRISALGARKAAEKERIALVADVGMALSLLSAAAFISFLFARFSASLSKQAHTLQNALTSLQQAHEHMLQSEKLAALGQLVAGIAHEFNTPLGAIGAAAGNSRKALASILTELPKLHERLDQHTRSLFTALFIDAPARKELVTSSERRPVLRTLVQQLEAAGIGNAPGLANRLLDLGVQDELEQVMPLLRHGDSEWLLGLAYEMRRLQANNDTIATAAGRASKIVFALNNYARVENSAGKTAVDLRESVETVLELYKSRIREGVELECHFEALAPMPAHADELIQVWANLVHNALQAMDGKGRLQLATGARDGQVVVSVTDSGPGIAPDIQARIFEPFFTTKARGEGSGLGLHICTEIVSKHDGRIAVTSQPGRTTFEVWLPAPAPADTFAGAAHA